MTSNGNGNKKTTTITVTFAVVILTGVTTWLFTRLDRLDDRIIKAQIAISQLEVTVRQIDDLVKITRIEQIGRTSLFGQLNERIANAEGRFVGVDVRVDRITERIMVLNKRVDDVINMKAGKVKELK